MGSTKKKTAARAGNRKSGVVVKSAPISAAQRAHLVEVGGRFSTARLVDFAHAVLAKVPDHADGFARFGLGAAWLASVEAHVAAVSSTAEDLSTEQGDTLPSAEKVAVALAAAKEWRREAVTVLAVADAGGGFAATGGSIPKLIAAMRALLPRVAKSELAAYGGGPAMKTKGAAIIATLEAARAAHAKAIGKLPAKVRDVHAAKGQLVEELNRLARAARTVAPEEASLFAISSHLHPRRAKRKPAPTTTTGQTKTA